MPKSLPAPSPKLNRLRAAAALIPIIESGMADSKLSPERAALMASFCEWASEIHPSDEGETKLQERIREGLQRLHRELNEERQRQIANNLAEASVEGRSPMIVKAD